jgi:hypothetical protein
MKPNKPRPPNYKTRLARKKKMAKELAPPGANWVIESLRELRLGAWIFPRGSLIEDIAALGSNASKLFASNSVRWAPPSSAQRPQRRPLQSAAAQKPKPVVQIVHHADKLESWYLTIERMTTECDGDRKRAEDLLFSNLEHGPEARRLYQTATAIACELEKERLAKMGIARRSVSPSELTRPL